MTGYIGKTTNLDPDLIDAIAQELREDMWGDMAGEVVSFDPETQTAKVKPLYKKRLDGEARQLPDLEEVPVRFPRLGGFAFTSPVKPGDRVRLSPQMRNTENFHEDDGEFEAADYRTFSLSDMEAFLDGGEGISRPIPNFNNTNAEWRSEDGQFAFEFSEDGKFRLRGATANWFSLLREIAELLASDTLAIKRGSSIGSGHELEHKAKYAEIAGKLAGMEL